MLSEFLGGEGPAVTVFLPHLAEPGGQAGREGLTEGWSLEEEESLSFTWEGWRKGSRESLHPTSRSLQPSFFTKEIAGMEGRSYNRIHV